MTFSSEIKGVKPDIAASALVGHYLLYFSIMEASLNDCIEAALEMSGIQIYVVSANLTFRSKINIIRTINNERKIVEATKASSGKILDRAASHSTERNIMNRPEFVGDYLV